MSIHMSVHEVGLWFKSWVEPGLKTQIGFLAANRNNNWMV